MNKPFRSVQIRTIFLCWLVYAVVYFGRLNLSVAIPELQILAGVGKSRIGLVGTLFFWFYGVGQLAGGTLGDRVSIRFLVFAGLFASAMCNFLFSLTRSLLWMAILWAFNGIFQSLVWGPLVKTITRWVAPERRSGAMVAVSTSMVGGFLLAWGLLGLWAGKGAVQWLFLIPAVSMAATSLLWLVLMRDSPAGFGIFVPWAACENTTSTAIMRPADIGHLSDICRPTFGMNTKVGILDKDSPSLMNVFLESRLWLIILACFAQGIVRDGITLWAPTFFMEAHGMQLKDMTTSLLFLPVMNLGGILLSGWLSERLGKRAEAATAILFLSAMALLGCLIVFGRESALASVVFLGLVSGMMYGVNTLLLGVVPLQFERYGRSSSVSGLLNFLAYMASGIASAFTGWMVDLSGWQGVLVSWSMLAAIGTAALFSHEWMTGRDARKSMEMREEMV